MKIADLFFGTHLDDMGITAEAGKLGDKAGATLGAKMSGGLKKASTGLLDGLKLGAGIAAFGALDTAVSSVVGIMGQAVAAARADEESQSRLGAALRANIPGWDGNTKAIEETILAREKLGFTDEEQRKSMALLVAATHDVNKAFEINRTAMDLARLKGISLEEASSALVKVEGGQYRALKALGIQLPKNATAQDALNAVQKVANGQAEEYAKTSEGRLLNSQIKLGEALEKLGYVLMPAVTDAMEQIAENALPVIQAFVDLATKGQATIDWANNLVNANHEAGDSLDGLGSKTDPLGKAIHWLADQLTNVDGQTRLWAEATKGTASVIDSDGRGMVRSLGTVVTAAKTLVTDAVPPFHRMRDASGNAAARIKENARDIATALKNLTATLLGQVTALINGYYDPIIAQDDLRVQKDTVAADTLARNATKANTVQRREADLTLANSQKTLDQTRANLLASGDLSAKDQRAWLADLQKRYKTATGSARTEIGKLIAKIKELQGLSGAHVNITTTFKIGGKATGGPVTAGTPYYVNENTPNSEIWVPDVSGKVLSGAVPVQAAGGGVTNTTYNIPVTVAALPAARSPFQIASTLRRFAEDGVLAPEPVLR